MKLPGASPPEMTFFQEVWVVKHNLPMHSRCYEVQLLWICMAELDPNLVGPQLQHVGPA